MLQKISSSNKSCSF